MEASGMVCFLLTPVCIALLIRVNSQARHVMASLCGLQKVYGTLPVEKQAAYHVHLTLLDVHEVTMARDLCTFLLLDELNRTTDATGRTEIKATLMYMFCGAAMPSYCYRRFVTYVHCLKCTT